MIFTSGERFVAQLGLPRHDKSHPPLIRCVRMRTAHIELRKDLLLRTSSLWALMLQSLQGHYRGIYTVLWWEPAPKVPAEYSFRHGRAQGLHGIRELGPA